MRRIDPTAFRIARRGTSREINRQIALNLIRSKQPVSRADLARLMGVRRGVVSRLVDELLEAGLIFEGAKGESRRGRKPMHLHLETRRRCVVAVDVSASQTAVTATDLLGTPTALTSLFDNNTVYQGQTTFTGVDRNHVGFYLFNNSRANPFYSEDGRNSGGSPQVLTYQGTGANALDLWMCFEDSPYVPTIARFVGAILEVESMVPTPALNASWGSLKALYR